LPEYFQIFHICSDNFQAGGGEHVPPSPTLVALPRFAARLITALKGELGVIQIYFGKIALHQGKFLVASVLSNSPWLPRYMKKCPKWNY